MPVLSQSGGVAVGQEDDDGTGGEGLDHPRGERNLWWEGTDQQTVDGEGSVAVGAGRDPVAAVCRRVHPRSSTRRSSSATCC